jgi:3-hydroxyisobutyrate dehydrogenase
MDLGFIGVGRMGGHMVRHLASAGHRLAVYDVRPQATADAAKLDSVRVATSAADAVRDAEVVFTSLPGPPEVEAVVLDEGSVRDSMRAGAVYVDLSTNAPALVRRLAPLMAERGVSMLDAPVSGGVEGAEAGTLSVMVGGDEAAFERVRPVLSAFGTKLFYCGPIGAGSVVKLCNNITGAAIGVILSEALTLGVKAGVELRTLADVIAASTGSSHRLTSKLPRYLFQRNFEPGFAVSLSAKDTRLALELAAENDVPMAMGEVLRRALEEAIARGWGDLDSDSVARLQEERAGVELKLP